MVLEAYEEEVLFSMYDKQIIGYNYTSLQNVASGIKWSDIVNRYNVNKKFENVIRHLSSKGYVDFHGKSGKVASLSKFGVEYVLRKTSRSA